MNEHFIPLSCASCGAKLDVYDDMERFACGYCGKEMVVQRRGGTISLKGVTDAIKQVQTGTDKTAAELALVRLLPELDALIRERQKTAWLTNSHRSTELVLYLMVIVFGAFYFLIGLTFAMVMGTFGMFLVALMCIGLYPAGKWLIRYYKRLHRQTVRWYHWRSECLASLDARIADAQNRIALNREIVART